MVWCDVFKRSPQRSGLILVTKLFFILLPSKDMAYMDAYPPADLSNFSLASITPLQIQIFNSFPMIIINPL